jgi:hypothetical protein
MAASTTPLAGDHGRAHPQLHEGMRVMACDRDPPNFGQVWQDHDSAADILFIAPSGHERVVRLPKDQLRRPDGSPLKAAGRPEDLEGSSRRPPGTKSPAPEKAGFFDDHEFARIIVRVAGGDDIVDEAINRLPYEWGECLGLAQEDAAGGIDRWFRWLESRSPDRVAACREAIDRARADPDGDREEVGGGPIDLGIVGSAEFARSHYPREWLARRILVKGRPGVIGGPQKAMKTSTVIDLVVSLGVAGRFLGEFEVPDPVKTLLISGESGEATIQETMRRVCRSKGIDPVALEGQVFWGFTLPQLGSPENLAALARFISEKGIEVVIIDPLYLCLTTAGKKVDPSNLFDVGPLLKTIAEVCLEAGATPFLVHHFGKNRENLYGLPDMEDLAFSGIQEFARQWILVGRRERYEPGSGRHNLWLTVGGSDGHSGEWSVDVEEGIVGEDFRDRRWDVTITRAAEAIDQAMGKKAAAWAQREAEKATVRDQARSIKLQDDAEAALRVLGLADGRRRTKGGWRSAMGGWSGDRINSVVDFLLSKGRIRAVDDVTIAGAKGNSWTGQGFEFVGPLPESKG